MSTHSGPTPELFLDAMFAYTRTAAVRAAVDVELFTAVDEGHHTVAAIATRCQSSERGIRILADYLTVAGFLRKAGDQYTLTDDSTVFLSKRSPAYMGTVVDFLGAREPMRNFEQLTERVRSGSMPRDASTVSDDNPVWVTFAKAMTPMMMPSAQAIAGVLGVASAGPMRVLDLAAGHGIFGIVLAERNPQVTVTAVDWPAVLDAAAQHAAEHGVAADRYRRLPGDAFAVEFGAGYDVALVTNFLHHFDRETNVAFMRTVRAALTPGGRAVVVEFVPNEDRVSPPMAGMFAIMMLAGTPRGTTYTLADLSGIAKDAGFRHVEAHAAPPQTIVVMTA
ncbi:MAG TPA: class I SAM-dependent methyltransferase [Vicinamibacterales bacterium]|nr:class I SAM-dependent methyltransferase [Vicinamibacterales bacterium]